MNTKLTKLLLVFIVVLFCQQAVSQTIVYPSGGSNQELLAAKEVRRYIYLRTDQKLALQGVTSLPATGDLILVANDNNAMVESLRSLINHTTNPGGFIIKTVNSGGRNILVITGNDSAATLKAAYRYAEHLGVGFGLAGDAIPDAKITLDISGLDEVGEPLFPTCGIQPFHDFPEGPDFWNTDDYMAVISQLPKLGMNFIGIHTYPTWNTLWDKSIDWRRGPEPSVWIGLQEDVNPDGTVSWSYPSYYAHTKRPNNMWGFDTWDTANFHAGSSQLFPTNGYGSDVIGETFPTDMPGYNAVFNRAGALFNEAFTHAQNLGVKTATGTELPLGLELDGGDSWVRGMPTELQDRLTGMGKNPADPCVVKDVYKTIFDRIMKTHPLDYYWLWSWEIWSAEGVTAEEIQAFKNDINLAQAALAELGNPFQIGHAGWRLGTVDPDNPAEFEDVFPPEAPFFSLWGSATGFESLSAERVKWPATWMEYDFGLEQPQLAAYRVHEDVTASWNKNCDGFITELWRTRILSPTIGSMKDLLWCYGPTGTPVMKNIPSNAGTWMDAYYLDWATRQFGPEAASSIAAIFSAQDWENLPHALGWTDDEVEGFMAPGAILCNGARWSREQDKYSFVGDLEALRSQIVGAGNLERFDYWLKAMQCLRIMGEYGCIRDDFEKAMNRGKYTDALDYRIAMANLWEQLMTLMVEKATNASDLGEIVNLEILNWKQLMMNKWDALLEAGLGGPLPPEANPYMNYTGSAVVKVAPARTQIADGESLELRVLIMENPTSATIYYRPLGGGSYTNLSLTNVARGVYEVTVPAQPDDFEYYIDAQTPIGNAVYPASATAINQTVVVLSPSCPIETDPPTPDPMTWASAPSADNATTISMTATTATDDCAVEYFFDETSGNPGGSDSIWQSSTNYTDTDLSPETQYCYRVKARDKTINQNETAWSSPDACATTPAAETTPPEPDPMTWATVPYATGEHSIAMVATTATDPSGVQYYFANVTDPNHDSGWQDDPEYIDTGLLSSTEYCYQVKARDKSPNQNETAWSSPNACATTEATPSWTKVDDRDASVTLYGSNWTLGDGWIPGAYMDTLSLTSSSGHYAIYSFTGTKVRLYGAKADDGGNAAIYIDSVPDGTVNFFSIEDLGDVLLYESGTLSSSSHELKVERTSGTVYLDAFEYAGTPCNPTDCHVEALNCGTAAGDQGKKYGKVTITIQDDCGNPVVGADVTGTFTGDFNEQLTETTDGNGQAVITTTTQIKKPTYQFCVDDVVHTLPYDETDNVVTCCSK